MEKTGAAKKSKAKRERRERRFLPRSTTNPLAVRVAGGLGAAALGAGAWAQVGRGLVAKGAAAMSDAAQPLPYAPWILAGGAVLLGVSIWFGTSGDPPVFVGDAGVAVDKGGMRRMAWHQIESVTFDGSTRAVVARGTDDGGAELVVRCPVGSQPQAAAWLLKEARARVPSVVTTSTGIDVSEDPFRDVPAARDDAGESIALDPLQVVGKRCADSGEIIAYEPDARVCRRCERVYHKAHVPAACACGASLASLQAKAS